jgi:trimeric autotransporter adhesin
MKRTACLLIYIFMCFSAAVGTVAQSYTGGIRGAVRDARGVIPGAGVFLINEVTNTKRTTNTNAEGEYAFTDVAPGTYTLKTSLNGYKTFESRRLRIGTQQFITLDLILEVGDIRESVTVTNQNPLIENATASVGESLDNATLERLPTAGRNAFFLSVTTAGVVPSGDPQFVRQQDQTNSSLLSLGGGPRRANNYTMDGVSITDLANRAIFIPSIEALDEVKIQVSTYDAEMGRTGGGVFNATAKSGANAWHGSVFLQNRPQWGQGKLFFARSAPKPDTYFYLYGGSLGGPIVRDKTFFWVSSEGYQTKTARSTVLILPTERERSGDFSQSAFTVFDPLTTRPNPSGSGFLRDAFAGNIIPPARINPVAREMLKFLPLPTSGNQRPAVGSLVDRAKQATLKLEHRFNDKLTSTLTYAYYDSEEPPIARFYGGEPGDNPGDPGEAAVLRRVHMVALNNTFLPSNDTVVNVRFGFTRFEDDLETIDFDPASLGFSPGFTRAITYKKFPIIAVAGYGSFFTLGSVGLSDYSRSASASVSKLFGRHTVKAGGEYRLIGMTQFSPPVPSGVFVFTAGFTQGPNPLVGGPASGNSLASFLLGAPVFGSVGVATSNNFFIDYYAGYVQDDFRLTPNVTLNLGLRYEFEQGLRERDNRITVGFDRDRTFPVQVALPDGRTLKGGLIYAGVDGYPTHQGNPSKRKFAPRVGFAWSINPKTVLRAGSGLFWSPNQYPLFNSDAFGTRGFTAATDYVTSTDGGLSPCATCTLTNPFPNGIQQPRGSADGLLTGAGGTIHFVDQFRKSAYVHQYSIDLQRELPGAIAVSVGYLGSSSQRLSVGGTNSGTVNINQLEPRFQSLGAALLDPVPNPFFGNAAFGALAISSTLPRGQLLRPYPQFTNVLAHEVSAGNARYNALVLKAERRLRGGWGLRANYTLSSNKDNVFGESNFFSGNSVTAVNNYDLDAEYAHSLLSAPHRLNIVGTFELPFGEAKRWLSRPGLLRFLFSGWSLTAIGTYQSGFPVAIVQNNNNSGLLGSSQRPNIVPGINPGTTGQTEDRLNNWFNPAAWTEAPPFTFGNAPRTDARVRTPTKKNWDIAVQKTQNLAGEKTLMIRAELINAFDEPNFLGPATSFGRPDFGRITQVGGFPRLVQLMIRFAF